MRKSYDLEVKIKRFKSVIYCCLFSIVMYTAVLILLTLILRTLYDDKKSVVESFHSVQKQGAMLHQSRLNFFIDDGFYDDLNVNYNGVYNKLTEYEKKANSICCSHIFSNRIDSELKISIDKKFDTIYGFLGLNHYSSGEIEAFKNDAQKHYKVWLFEDGYLNRRDAIKHELGSIHLLVLNEFDMLEKYIHYILYWILMFLVFTLCFLLSYMHRQGEYVYSMIWSPLSHLSEQISNNSAIKTISELDYVDFSVRDLVLNLQQLFRDYSSKIQSINDEKNDVSIALKKVSNNLVQRDIQISTIVHDLKTPLQSAVFGTDTIDSSSKLDNERAILDIKSSLSYASRLINETHLFESSPDVDPSGICYMSTLDFTNDIESILNNLLIKHNVDLKFIVNQNFPKGFTFQRHALYQVVINLLSNAITHSNTNQVRFRFVYDASTKEMGLKIVDFGTGFKYDKVDSADFTLDARTRNGKGLRIVNLLCDKYDIKLSVFSSLNRGTIASLTFSVDGACNISTLKNLDNNRSTINYSNELTITNAKIIIAEDFEPSRRMMEQLSKKYSLNTIFCKDGQEVLDIVELDNVDMLVLDLEMPKLSGIQVSEILKRNEKTSHIPIFGFSADISKEKEALCIDAGMELLIAKPINFQELIYILENYRKLYRK